ncbi:hypothetical protein BDV96DRAFT_629293 [Lophiotrema nucula]|uniref:Uncharacterized protein n=1 Tax=Lophiotrema nucula TaxID=690887 RepID=A0A6A5ZJN3_9PLEO|nr:hypothetical protein BDV96DRAFT_629293 [Lophiotrema nucula]
MANLNPSNSLPQPGGASTYPHPDIRANLETRNAYALFRPNSDNPEASHESLQLYQATGGYEVGMEHKIPGEDNRHPWKTDPLKHRQYSTYDKSGWRVPKNLMHVWNPGQLQYYMYHGKQSLRPPPDPAMPETEKIKPVYLVTQSGARYNVNMATGPLQYQDEKNKIHVVMPHDIPAPKLRDPTKTPANANYGGRPMKFKYNNNVLDEMSAEDKKSPEKLLAKLQEAQGLIRSANNWQFELHREKNMAKHERDQFETKVQSLEKMCDLHMNEAAFLRQQLYETEHESHELAQTYMQKLKERDAVVREAETRMREAKADREHNARTAETFATWLTDLPDKLYDILRLIDNDNAGEPHPDLESLLGEICNTIEDKVRIVDQEIQCAREDFEDYKKDTLKDLEGQREQQYKLHPDIMEDPRVQETLSRTRQLAYQNGFAQKVVTTINVLETEGFMTALKQVRNSKLSGSKTADMILEAGRQLGRQERNEELEEKMAIREQHALLIGMRILAAELVRWEAGKGLPKEHPYSLFNLGKQSGRLSGVLEAEYRKENFNQASPEFNNGEHHLSLWHPDTTFGHRGDLSPKEKATGFWGGNYHGLGNNLLFLARKQPLLKPEFGQTSDSLAAILTRRHETYPELSKPFARPFAQPLPPSYSQTTKPGPSQII